MNNFIKSIKINKIRHLENIDINLSSESKKHLILTGKNGSGKTSLLESVKSFLSIYENNKTHESKIKHIDELQNLFKKDSVGKDRKLICKRDLENTQQALNKIGLVLDLGNEVELLEKYQSGEFVFAYYSANRFYKAVEYKHIEKVDIKDNYKINEKPGNNLVKYLVDLKTTQSLAQTSNKLLKADEIKVWFENFENMLKDLFDDNKLELDFDIDDFQFNIKLSNREPFKFNQMSSGYSAIFEIISDLMLRMEKNSKGLYQLDGIVLIDEIDTHLHLELQKKIFPFLTKFFPNIQFIMTTHSPFILSSSENVVIYDLENNIELQDGLQNLPYNGIVEGYFEVDVLSQKLKSKFDRYKELAKKETLDNDDYGELAELEIYLDEIPDYLAFEVTNEYLRLKLEFENRE